MSIREKYNIPQEAKVLLYVGNISKNKNQAQMVRAFALLPEEVRQNTWVLFCGKYMSGEDSLNELVSQVKAASHLVLCGAVNREIMADYYQSADGVVLLSYAEGFGLSLIEGMHFGLPCAMPTDLDAHEDIYNPNAVVAINDRSDKAVAKGIGDLLSKEWNSQEIKVYSSKFESRSMAKSYISVYRKIAEI